jgi:hypothetical protein
MKESRFIELLNLYIDRQITAAETAELEAELQRDPKRQVIYRQYCKIHSATKLVYESFRAEAADQPAGQAGRGGVVELFETRRRRNHWAMYAGGFAAAACLALVFVATRNPAQNPAAPVVAIQSQPAATIASTAALPAPAVTPAPAGSAHLVSLRDTVEITPDYAAMIVALREQDEERAFTNERLQIGRVQPLFQDDMFSQRRLLSSEEQRVFRSQPAVVPANAQQAEFSAFQFQR